MIELRVTVEEKFGSKVLMEVRGAVDSSSTPAESSFCDLLMDAMAKLIADQGGSGHFRAIAHGGD